MAKRPFDQINNIDDLITTSERLGGYFLDKETATIKDFTIVYCGTGTIDGDNHAVDKTIFEAFLKRQLQGMVVLAARHNLHPDKLEEEVSQVYDYFGL